MMQKKSVNMTFILVLLGITVLGTFFLPTVAKGCAPQAVMPRLSDEVRKTYVEYMAGHRQDPAAYIVNAFDRHDVVVLGDLFSRDTYSLVRGLLPALYKKGVRVIGFQWAYAKSQAALDALFASDRFDEQRARDILTEFFSELSFAENLNLFRDLWTWNRGLPRGAERFRLVALAPNVDMKALQDEKNRDNKDVLRRAYNGVSLDEACLGIVRTEILDAGKKALLYMHNQLAFRSIELKSQIDQYAALGIPYRGTVSRLLREKIGDRVLVVYFHNVWFVDGISAVVYPFDGIVDAVIKELPADARRTVISVAGSPFQDFPVQSKLAGKDGRPVVFRDLCDAYVLLGELADYRFSRLPEDGLTDALVDKILAVNGLDREKAKVGSALEFVKVINEKLIDKVNGELAALPR